MEENSKKKFGFAIIGTGSIASFHADAIAAINNAELVAVQSQTYAKAMEFASRYNCEAYESIDELLRRDDVDIVCICTPSGAHGEPALKCIDAGKHCLIEKPLEVSLEKSDEIIKASRAKNVTVAVVFPSRFYESSQHVKTALEGGRFGKVALASAYVKWNRTEDYYKSASWRGTWHLDGGGALMNQAIHTVDMLQWCLGPISSVMAFQGNIKHTDIEVEDTLVAVLQFSNGALGTIECSTAVFPGTFKKLEIMGTKGTAVIEDNTLVKWQFDAPGDALDPLVGVPGDSSLTGGASNPLSISYAGHQKQIEDLIQAISEGGKPMVDAVEGRKSVEIVLAIYESARIGRIVRLPLKADRLNG